MFAVTVSGGRRPRISIKALCICSAVPSKNFPQPATNRVSPAWEKQGFLGPLSSHKTCLYLHSQFISYKYNLSNHTCKDSWWFSAVFFGHVVTNVTSRVTRSRKAFNMEWANLRREKHKWAIVHLKLIVGPQSREFARLTLKVLEWETFFVMASTLSSPP